MLKSFLTRFTRDEEGGIAVETALIFPMLCWGYLATFVYFNAFHTQNTTLKAAYTISDQISRETGYITPSYLKGLYRLHEVLTNSNEPTVMRLSVIEYDSEEDTDIFSLCICCALCSIFLEMLMYFCKASSLRRKW